MDDEENDGEKNPPVEECKEERAFRVNVFYKVMDLVIGGLNERFKAAEKVKNLFQCLWTYKKVDETDIENKCSLLQSSYPDDLGLDLKDEVKYLKVIHDSNFRTETLTPLQLINKLKKLTLEGLFPNVWIAIRIFCTVPVTVVEAERSFSQKKLFKNVMRSTMGQQRTSLLFIVQCRIICKNVRT